MECVGDDSVIVRKYFPAQIICQIGKGSFGTVFQVKGADGKIYALKQEPEDPTKCKVPQLEHEMLLYKDCLKGLACVPQVFMYATILGSRSMLFERLGKSLESIKTNIKGDNVLWIGTRLVYCIEQIHNRGVIHRDLKPENMLIGPEDNPEKIGRSTNLFIVDFGLAKRFIDQQGHHITWATDKKLSGTARYASINTHHGYQQSRRDDLESLGYVLIYLYLGKLPWMGLRSGVSAAGDMKNGMSLEKLCAGCPTNLLDYMRYFDSLILMTSPTTNTSDTGSGPLARRTPAVTFF